MEYAKDEFFKIRYNTELNKLQMKKEKWTSKIYKKIKNHKFLFSVSTIFLLFSIINIIMINKFMQLLLNIYM